MEEVAKQLAARVKQLRTQTRMTQAELAARAGVTVETVARLERVLRGRSSANANPSLETLARLSSALGVDVPDILATKGRARPKDDRLFAVLRSASPETKRRVLRIAEVLVREDRVDQKPPSKRRRSR